MNCPVDNTPLTISERQGVEIDFCPTCRGVWLDRGELDKLIERSKQFSNRSDERDYPREQSRDHDSRETHRHEEDDDHRRHDSHGQGGHKRHKKESFLGDLFDF